MDTFNRVEDAIQFYEKSKIAPADASFNFRKWATNSKKIQNLIDNQFKEDKTSESTHRKFMVLFGIFTQIILYLILPTLLNYAIHYNRQREISYEFKESFTTHLN